MTTEGESSTSEPLDPALAEPVSKLPLLIMGGIVALAVLITIALVAVRKPEEFAAGTPEATIQQYVNAAFDDDADTMLSLLTPANATRCRAELDDHPDWLWRVDDLRAELDDVQIDGDSATLEVRFRRVDSNDPFDNSSYAYDRTFRLVRSAGEWQVADADWPNVIESCTRVT